MLVATIGLMQPTGNEWNLSRRLSSTNARHRGRRALVLALSASGLFAVPSALGQSVVATWNDAALQSVRDLQPGAPMAARVLAVTHTAMFDAWSAYDAQAVSTEFGSALRRPRVERTAANRQEAISYAAFEALAELVPEEESTLRQVMATLGYRPGWSPANPSLAALVGHRSAQAVLRRARLDGAVGSRGGALASVDSSVNGPDDVTDASRWQPLLVTDVNGNRSVQTFLLSYWGNVRPTALTSGAEFRPARPAKAGTPARNGEIQEIVNLQAGLVDRQKVIVEEWSDRDGGEYAPGRWNLIARWVSERDGNSLAKDVTLFFVLNRVLFDTSIATWDAKRAYDRSRPITAVRAAFRGQQVQGWAGPGKGIQPITGEAWSPYQAPTSPTPATPEYVSEESAFAAAGARVLRRLTGSDRYDRRVLVEAGSSGIEPGLTPARATILAWPTFTSAADQAGIAQRYGGVQFRSGDLAGRELGRRVGERGWKLVVRYLDGSAPRPRAVEAVRLAGP